MEQLGLVLEGGGLRGVYTAGVLDFFMDHGLYFPYVIGVSAGACNGASYISRQRGRSLDVNVNFIRDSRYISYRNLIRYRSLFGMDFIFDEIPNKLLPFDFETFYKSEQKFLITATDCNTGKAVYFDKDTCGDALTAIKASSSLPFVSPIVNFNGMKLLDGGISDPIPIKKSISDGNKKNVIVLTRNRGYRKKPSKMKFLAKRMYKKYDELICTLSVRHMNYNDTLDFVDFLEFHGDAFVIQPTQPIIIGRMEKDPQKLITLYEMGYIDAERRYKDMMEWMEKYKNIWGL